MSKLQEVLDDILNDEPHRGSDYYVAAIREAGAEMSAMRSKITETEAELARLTRERDEVRNNALDEAAFEAEKRGSVTARDAILALKTKEPTNG